MDSDSEIGFILGGEMILLFNFFFDIRHDNDYKRTVFSRLYVCTRVDGPYGNHERYLLLKIKKPKTLLRVLSLVLFSAVWINNPTADHRRPWRSGRRVLTGFVFGFSLFSFV